MNSSLLSQSSRPSLSAYPPTKPDWTPPEPTGAEAELRAASNPKYISLALIGITYYTFLHH